MTGDGGAMQAPTDDKQLEKGLKDKTQSSGPGLWPFIIVSSSYLLYTITDGAIRMVVLLHAYEKGFSAMEVAIMFTLYEVAGVVTNLLAGIAGSRWGLRTTLLVGLSLQLVGISSLFGWEDEWGKLEAIIFVTFSQMLCGIAKDLTKLGGKTVAKLVTPDEKQSSLFRLVSFITGMNCTTMHLARLLPASSNMEWTQQTRTTPQTHQRARLYLHLRRHKLLWLVASLDQRRWVPLTLHCLHRYEELSEGCWLLPGRSNSLCELFYGVGGAVGPHCAVHSWPYLRVE